MVGEQPIEYDNLGDALVSRLPQLRRTYEKEMEWWGGDDPGPHNLFSAVLNPNLISMLSAGGPIDELERAFAFLEELAQHDDIRVREVVGTTVLERLAGDQDLLVSARQLMLPATRELSDTIEEAWGRKD